MGLTVKKNTAVGVEIEDTEGTYKAPQATTSYIQTLQDGFELSQTKEIVERNVFTSSIGKTSPRSGMFLAGGTIPAEMRANSTEGNAPEIDKLMRSALGDRHQITSETTTEASQNAGADLNTASLLLIGDLDIGKFEVGDIVKVKQSGAHHVSPISAVDDTIGLARITLLIPKPTGVFSPSVVISKSTTYIVADSGHAPLSISKYIENAVREYAVGCKVTTMSLEQFSTGQLPQISFGFEGLNFDRSLTAPPFTPAYNAGLPPIMMDGRVYMDAGAIDVNEITVSLENTLGFVTSIAAPNGRVSSRVTDRAITGTFNPYKQDNSIANFTKYKAGTPFSLFAYGKVPSSTAGEFDQVIAIYMPNCVITEMGEADQDGILQDSITFSADRGVTGSIPEIYIAFI